MLPDGTEKTCQWVNQSMAFQHFAAFDGGVEGAAHIRPLHWYIASRLVIEGGFLPDDITPRPPFRVQSRRGENLLFYEPALSKGGERTVLGGLKTKRVDVVVTRDGIGPVIGVSCKGTTGAFRNLTNRMEETVGECTNLHITYPAMVVGYFSVMRANRRVAAEASAAIDDPEIISRPLTQNDMAFTSDGDVVEGIVRFHSALREMTGRRGIRDDISRYEAMTIALLEVGSSTTGNVVSLFPPEGSSLRLEEFFKTLYARYDERYVFSAPELKRVTRRREWSPDSEVFRSQQLEPHQVMEYAPRLAGAPGADAEFDDGLPSAS